MSVSYLAIFARLHRQATMFDRYSATDDKTKEIKYGNESPTTSESKQHRLDTSTPAENVNQTGISTTADHTTTICDSDPATKHTRGIRRFNKRGKASAHMNTLKMFFFVTVIFVISYIPLVLETRLSRTMTQLYFIALQALANTFLFIVLMRLNR